MISFSEARKSTLFHTLCINAINVDLCGAAYNVFKSMWQCACVWWCTELQHGQFKKEALELKRSI